MKSLILVAALVAAPFAMAQTEGAAPAEPAKTEKMDKKAECEQAASAAGKKGSKEYKKAWKQCMHAKK